MTDPGLDLLVIGAGACGLAGAIAAHDSGLTVAVIEKRDRPGGNSAISTGSVPAANSRFQREANLTDSPSQFVRDLMGIAGETDDLALVERLAEVSAATVEWLFDVVHARLTLITAYKHIGHSVQRLHAPVSRRGQDLVDDMLTALNRREIPLALGNGAVRLVSDNGRVVGAVIDAGQGEETILARNVLLAVNGFAADPVMVRQFCPEIAGASYFGALGSTGEAIRWGQELGADLANMGAYQGYAAVAYPQGSLLSWTTIEKGGLLIGDDARRFGDESLGYSGYARIVLERGGNIYAVFDQRIFEIAMQEEEFAELWRYRGVQRALSPQEAATLVGLDPQALAKEIEDYNASAAGERPDRLGRKEFALAPLQGPFYIGRVVPGLFHTQGGLRVNGDAQVLRPDGSVIAGLFAGGGAAAGISGRQGALGYASGNGLLSAIALGRLAGLAAARERSLQG